MAGAPIPTGCVTCSAWFHYEDGSKDGYWVVGLTGSCDDIRTTVGGSVSYFGFPLTDLNPNARLIWIALNEAKFPIKLQALADDLYAQAQTKLSDTSRPANDFTVVCADVANPGAGCPPGTYWDGPTETCKPLVGLIRIPIIPPSPITVTPPPPAPPPYVIPPPLPADSEGDELERCCAQSAYYMFQIAKAIQNLAAAQSDRATDPCCLLVVQQLTLIATRINSIVNLMAAPPPDAAPAIDLTKVTDELKCICDALAAANSPDAPTPTAIRDGTKSIADALANAPATDLKPLVDAINAFAKILDVKQPVIDYLVKNGLLDPQMAQIAASADLGDTVANFWSKYGKYIIAGSVDTIGGSVAAGHVIVPDPATPAKRDLGGVFGSMLKGVDSVFEPALKPIITGLLANLAPATTPPIGQAGVSLDAPASTAFGVAFTAAAASYILSFFGIDAGATLAWIAELLAGAVGWEELRDLRLKPFIENGIARVVQMEAKALFQQELPGNGQLTEWAARGLMDPARSDELMTLNGLHFSLRPIASEASYSGLNARMMIRLAGTGLFSDADIADELTFSGMRQSSQHRLILAAAFLATAPERSRLLSALEKLHTAGLISDNDLVSRIQSAEHNTDRISLIRETVQTEKQIALAKEYEAAYSREFIAGLLDAPGYQSALEGLGMQPPDVAARLFRDESHLLVTQTLGAERAARAQARLLAASERKAGVEAFRTGTTDAAGLSAALIGSGLSPAQVAAEVAYQILARSGVLRWIYGRQLPPAEATLLRQQVADLTRQRELEFLTDAQYVSQLTALSIPPRYIQALRAGADAHISPKTKAILTPPVAP